MVIVIFSVIKSMALSFLFLNILSNARVLSFILKEIIKTPVRTIRKIESEKVFEKKRKIKVNMSIKKAL